MAELIIPPGYAQCAFKVANTTVGHQCIWTCGVSLSTSPWTQAEADAFFTEVSDALKPLWDSNVHQLGFHALVGNDGPALAVDVIDDVSGTSGAMTTASPNVTYLLKKQTLFAGRSFRGRAYLPFVNTGELDENGRISGTVLTRFQTAASNLWDAALVGGSTGTTGWALLHREGTPGADEGPQAIVSFGASNVVATQRRRLER